LYIYTIYAIIYIVMEKSLTAKQKLIMATIQDLKAKLGKAPTLEEIRQALNYAGISSVQRHVNALKKKGVLSNERYQARTLEVTYPEQVVNIPLVGSVPCGTPFLAIENIEAYIPYNKSALRGDSGDYFFLRAVGDSMNNASISGKNIQDGDFVLVKKQQVANPGSPIVALIGDEATIKKITRDGVFVRLEPETTNLNNKPIVLFGEENFSIQGIVIDVIKKGGE